MSLRAALASNLRQLCNGEQSIAAVCRAANINRQQFNRYLSGDSLPNQRTRERICRYFQIDEPDLFREPAGPVARAPAEEEPGWSHTGVRAALKQIMSEVPTSITPGLYFAHFLIPQHPNSIARSTVVVRRDGNLTTFRRLTGLAEPRGSWWAQYVGDHNGVILERRHIVYFVGMNQRDAREPTFLVLRWQPVSRPILGGHAMILTPSGPTITPVVLSPCPRKTSLRAALRASHVYSADDARIEQVVADLLDQQRQSLITMTRLLNVAVEPVA